MTFNIIVTVNNTSGNPNAVIALQKMQYFLLTVSPVSGFVAPDSCHYTALLCIKYDATASS